MLLEKLTMFFFVGLLITVRKKHAFTASARMLDWLL